MSSSENLPASTAPAKLNPVGFGASGVELRSIEDLFRFGKAVVDSGLAPSAFKRPEQVVVAVQFGAEIGLGPMQSLQSIAVIGGKPSLMVEPALALVRASGLLVKYDVQFEGQGEERVCRVWLGRAHPSGTPHIIMRSFFMLDAKRAGLVGKDVWKSYPDRMLQARATGFALRDLFPDVLRGIGIAEEQADIPRERNIMPQRAAPTGPDPLLAQLESGEARTIELEPARETIEVESGRGDVDRHVQQGTTGEVGGPEREKSADDPPAGGVKSSKPVGNDEIRASNSDPLPDSDSRPSAGSGSASGSAPAEGSPIAISPVLRKKMRERAKQLGLVDSAPALQRLESMVVDYLGEGEREIDVVQRINGWKP